MITLRIKEIIEARGLSPETLSNLSSVPLKDIQAYITYPTIEGITDIIAEHLRKIAEQLKVPVIELVKPVAKQEAFRLKILELAKDKKLSLAELSKQSGVNFAVLAFYSTQPISQQKLAESQCQKHLSDITKVLNCRTEDLLVTADLPITKLCIHKMIQDRGILLEEYSILTGINLEFISLLATQPVDIDSLINLDLDALTKAFRVYCQSKVKKQKPISISIF